ncbi:hypothetical protein TARUN_8827 [Trichoderma arundinaceum]|uniref:Uncharacterized protein n=1 Tax=Trichoderma arundinaceum TaxID=490622 RepID=A0A395NBE2_TRIAR|nr:hypothetical protein TARUN_8827 [Trichoderma arundinaceum]
MKTPIVVIDGQQLRDKGRVGMYSRRERCWSAHAYYWYMYTRRARSSSTSRGMQTAADCPMEYRLGRASAHVKIRDTEQIAAAITASNGACARALGSLALAVLLQRLAHEWARMAPDRLWTGMQARHHPRARCLLPQTPPLFPPWPLSRQVWGRAASLKRWLLRTTREERVKGTGEAQRDGAGVGGSKGSAGVHLGETRIIALRPSPVRYLAGPKRLCYGCWEDSI